MRITLKEVNQLKKAIVKSFPEAEEMWGMLYNNECYCNLSDKPEEIKEVNPVISPKPEVIEVETEISFVPTQQEIKKEIALIEVEIEKLINLLNYLDNSDISGNIYDTTQEELDNLYQQLNKLEAQLDPTAEIKAHIEADQQELEKLSLYLTQAISELNILKVSQIQQEITNTVKEIKILQDKLSNNFNVVRLLG